LNAERLHIVAKAIQAELNSTRVAEHLQQLTSFLQNLSSQPGNLQFQQQVANKLAELEVALKSAPSNTFSPAWRQILTDIGADEFLGARLADKIRDLIERNEKITPQAAHQGILQIQQAVNVFKSSIDQLVAALGNLKIGSEDLAPGESEFGISIPREAVDDDLAEFATELTDLRFILRTFGELTTARSLSFPIRTISSSDLLVYVNVIPRMAAALARAAEWLIDQYKKLLDIREKITDLRKDGVPPDELKGIEKFANSQMEQGIEKIAIQIETEYSVVKDQDRKNELRTAMKFSLSMMANRLDQGFNFDVRIQPPQAADAKKDEDTEKAIATIRAASASLQFMRLGGAPILSLPEPAPELTQGPKKTRKKRPPKSS